MLARATRATLEITQPTFSVKQENEYFKFKTINTEMPQSSVLGAVLYLLYTHVTDRTTS